MKGLRVFAALLLASFLTVTVISQQTIEFLSANTDPPGQGIRYTTSMPTVPAIAKRCNKICFNGMWAMYTSTYYGAGNPNVTVYPAAGNSLQSCSTSVGPVASKINSFKQLAAPTTAMPVNGTGIEFWTTPYFIGNSSMTAPANTTLINSFAINSSLMPAAFVLCNPAGTCACCDTFNGHYLVPETGNWPAKGNSLGNMLNFTAVTNSSDTMCVNALYHPLK